MKKSKIKAKLINHITLFPNRHAYKIKINTNFHAPSGLESVTSIRLQFHIVSNNLILNNSNPAHANVAPLKRWAQKHHL